MAAEDVMAVDKRLADLEVTVAKGFAELGGRIGGLEGRMTGLEGRTGRLEDGMEALNTKLDVAVETLDAKMGLVLERLDANSREMRVLTDAIVKEHRADRRLMYSILGNHRVRLEDLEKPRAEG